MGKPLKNPPIYFTLVQTRFNPLLKLGEYLPSIQDAMRKMGYPAFSQNRSVVFELIPQPVGQPVPQPQTVDQYLFGTSDRQHCFVLSLDFLLLQSTDYGTFESLSEKFLKGLQLIHDAVSLDFTERVGLRYLDFVLPRKGDDLAKYLTREVQGLASNMTDKRIHSYSESLCRFDRVGLRARTFIHEGKFGFPPDISPQGMAVNERFTSQEGLHAILDTDGFIEARQSFSIESVEKQLDNIHEVVSSAFKATVTEYALNTWNS